MTRKRGPPPKTTAPLSRTAAPGVSRIDARSSERHQDVEQLGAVARLLDVVDLAAAAVRDAGLGDLVVADRVVGRDVLGPDDADQPELPETDIDQHLLMTVE